jgi:membrane fusion protein (multidrug efflux system)
MRRFARTPLAVARLPVCVLLAAAALTACGGGSGSGGPGGMPPLPVGVVTVQPGTVALTTELPGRLEAWRTAQVRARVPGVVLKRLFTEGADVKAGQSLFQLDAAAYRATLDSALATQGKAEANLAQAQATLQRNQPLVAAKAISQQEWIASETALKQAQADLASAKAAVQTARLNVDYAAVLAPIGGRIGRAQVTEGALVGQGEATLLATIQQIHPLYVNFTQSANEVLRLRQAVARGTLGAVGADATRVQVLLDDGSVYPQPGKLLFSDLTVDPTSGQVTLRAELPNPQGLLLPGLYVKVRIGQAQSNDAMLLPQQAVTRGAGGDTVLVVGADRTVSPRPVKLGGSQGTQWVVLGGLKAGEQVVVDGFQKIRPKVPVTPVPWSPLGASAAGAATAAAAASASAPASAGSR